MLLNCIWWIKQTRLKTIWEGGHCGIMIKMVDCGLKVNEFELQFRYSLQDEYTWWLFGFMAHRPL